MSIYHDNLTNHNCAQNMKNFILDTSVVLDNPLIISKLEGKVTIPFVVIIELEKNKDLGILPKPPGCLLCGGKYSRKCGIGIYNRGYPTEIPFFLYALCDKCLKKHKGNVESMSRKSKDSWR